VTKPDAMAARKKDKEENETLDDLQQNEVERGSIQPLLKTNSEAAERCSSEPRMCYGDLMRGGQMELRTENCEPFQPGLSALPSFSNHVVFRTSIVVRYPNSLMSYFVDAL
jgi:hypothetical protein